MVAIVANIARPAGAKALTGAYPRSMPLVPPPAFRAAARHQRRVRSEWDEDSNDAPTRSRPCPGRNNLVLTAMYLHSQHTQALARPVPPASAPARPSASPRPPPSRPASQDAPAIPSRSLPPSRAPTPPPAASARSPPSAPSSGTGSGPSRSTARTSSPRLTSRTPPSSRSSEP